ncbi:putative F-box domain, leucine-rich repeat domain, L domain-containing protein [Medicago truncatula]|uniref:F-box/RNI superfamily protein n=1 Tax=Medicago truncatula TaxID=3880 RepID=A0A072W2J2_MEDTR|nr:F-box/FBD/LRR-repeat protein At3g14710 [Medicago truncatula]KEH44455.1 F-box/RNI superfamily protein [Medicago truncatula]RHN82680.1 putative F-box domain, leucine-rich repeat domain, L domain-containing protein [Medicago truncatula]
MMHSASTSEAAAQPWKKRQKSSEGQDIISRLSDCIIAHILSFLPTNYAVRTSALSQRWRYMWTFVTKLCFSDNLLHFSVPFEEAKNRYIDFVCRVLLLNSATIQKFSLDISENLDPYHINLWISAISNKRVKNISVSVRSWINFNLSAYPLFKCQSLEELVLEMMCQCNIEVPTFVSLSSLTVLDLYGITLTLNLPVLRKYKTTYCIWFGVKSVTIEAPLLEVVSLNCNLLSPPKPDDYESRAEIKFCASHLTRFSYEGIIPSDNIVLDADITSTSIGLSISFNGSCFIYCFNFTLYDCCRRNTLHII